MKHTRALLEEIWIPLLALVGSAIMTIFGLGVWAATISSRVDAVASESARVRSIENDITRMKTILELQFPNAAKVADEKLR